MIHCRTNQISARKFSFLVAGKAIVMMSHPGGTVHELKKENAENFSDRDFLGAYP